MNKSLCFDESGYVSEPALHDGELLSLEDDPNERRMTFRQGDRRVVLSCKREHWPMVWSGGVVLPLIVGQAYFLPVSRVPEVSGQMMNESQLASLMETARNMYGSSHALLLSPIYGESLALMMRDDGSGATVTYEEVVVTEGVDSTIQHPAADP